MDAFILLDDDINF